MIGTNDQVTVKKWYKDDKHKLDQIVTGTGTLAGEDIDSLVDAMTAYAAPEGVGAEGTTEMEAVLMPQITDAWDLLP